MINKENTGRGNTGNRNTGNDNTGNRNTGNDNTGNRNTGYGNTGSCNTGDFNAGDFNAGDFNAGHGNTGSGNTGHGNTGDFNAGNLNTGNFNTGSWNGFRCFDKKLKRKDWDKATRPNFIFAVDPTKTNGDMKAAWAKAYTAATDEDILLLSRLPNFDAEVFKEITGIDVRERLAEVKGGEK